MPELPEVETVRRSLEHRIIGETISSVQLRGPGLRWPFQDDLVDRIAGRRIAGCGRRGKYLVIELARNESLICHLGMSGTFTVLDRHPGEFDAHDHVVFTMSGGLLLVYNDPRRFGSMECVATDALSEHRVLGRLGPEPVSASFTAEVLAAQLHGRRCSIKSALLNQQVVAGVGNIYACEALHRARIGPRARAGSLCRGRETPTPRCRELASALTAILQKAIEAGGSTLRDFTSPDGHTGLFPSSFRVYDREGLRCRRRGCDGSIRAFQQQGRTTFACPRCQRA